jgi:phosphoadenosine phosphosulfate reductase
MRVRFLPDLENVTTTDVLTWAFENFGDRVAISTAFGPSGVVLMHLASQIRPGVKAFFLDTDFHFPETLQMVERIAARLPLELEIVKPALTVDEQTRLHGDELPVVNPDLCCRIRKVEPTQRVLSGLDAWLTGLRRDQGSSRAATPVLEAKVVDGRDLVKINPMATWTRKDVWRHIFTHELPYNPLHDRGYASVGCWPCTRPTADAGDERSGRWAGTGKTECGLHTLI